MSDYHPPILWVSVPCRTCKKLDQTTKWLAQHGGPHECDDCRAKRFAKESGHV